MLESKIDLKLEKTKLSQLEKELELVLQENFYKTVCTKKLWFFLMKEIWLFWFKSDFFSLKKLNQIFKKSLTTSYRESSVDSINL
jgi:hypothetical protein